MRIFRSGSTGRPAQSRRADAELTSKRCTEATVDRCREDYATGADARADLDRASQSKARRLGLR
ncbi:hypothetical protein [Streptomyces coffeae]|uniref:Uncharacterized protein n=1 Tax=Streptomyces coffeae TaxID=621382 RepID=A0ABS1NJB2_9ACTN|nr:hypothetical protein [Streptomyces coffeae]MBL1100126.1 hypothetical protein [Streptomyces coffeae]